MTAEIWLFKVTRSIFFNFFKTTVSFTDIYWITFLLVPSIINSITINELWNIETYKMDWNHWSHNTNHGLFDFIHWSKLLLLSWLTATGNANVSWLNLNWASVIESHSNLDNIQFHWHHLCFHGCCNFDFINKHAILIKSSYNVHWLVEKACFMIV